MRRKSPAFQFYPDNFVSGAPAFMRPLETHVYIWLLCLDWSHGGFILDEIALSSWCHVSRKDFAKAWPKVRDSFIVRDGRWYNPRLDAERDKQRLYSERMSENGKRGGRPKADEKPTPKRTESRGLKSGKPNESIPSPSPSPRTTTSPPSESAAVFSLRPYLDAHLAKFPGSQPPAARYGKVFKALERKHGPVETLRRWKICLEKKGTFAIPEELASHWSEYGSSGPPPDEEGERKRIQGLVMGRRAKTDGDLWWARMQREANTTNGNELYRYAAQHLTESADGAEAA